MPAPREEGLDLALDLLKRLNRMRGPDGTRVAARVVVDGFEPWWFIQEQLYWGALVPYMAHRETYLRVLRGESVDIEHAAPEVRSLLGWLAAQSAGSPAGKRLANGVPAHARAAWLGLRLLSWLALAEFHATGRETLVYGIDKLSPGLDHDFRIGPIYRELHRRGYRFGEYLHVSDLRQSWRNLLRRGRPVVFFETLADPIAEMRPATWLGVDASSSDPDGAFLRALSNRALGMAEASVREYRVLKRALRLHGARRAVVLDDSRHANELVAACKTLRIPVLGYMHGLFNRYHPGLMAYGFGGGRRHTFDLYGVWSEYFRERLLNGDLYEDGDTFACGPLRPPTADELRAMRETTRQRDSERVRLLVVSEPRARQAEVDRYLEGLLNDERFEVIVKLRPGERRSLAKLAMQARLRVLEGGSVYQALREADVAVGCYSTMLYESILALRPAVVLNTSFTYGHELARDGLAEFAESPETVAEAVLRAGQLPEAELIRRRNAIWGERIDDGAAGLLDAAEAQLWSAPNG